MQLFLLDDNIEQSVKYYSDLHVSSILKEAVQIMSTIAHVEDAFEVQPATDHGVTHKNHPLVKAYSSSESKLHYLHKYICALQVEYKYRFNKIHGSYRAYKEANGDYFIPAIKLSHDIGLPNGLTGAAADELKNTTSINNNQYSNGTYKQLILNNLPNKYRFQDLVESYRHYYAAEKATMDRAYWRRGREKPGWIAEYGNFAVTEAL